MTEQSQVLATLSKEQVVEAATSVLLEHFKVARIEDAIDLVLSHPDREDSEREAIKAAAHAAAADDADQIARLLEDALESLSEEGDAEQRASILEAIQSAGEKSIIVDGNLIALGVLLLCAYAIKKTNGNAKVTETEIYEDAPDGSRLVKISRESVKINPFTPLGQLLDRIFGRTPAGKGDTAETE